MHLLVAGVEMHCLRDLTRDPVCECAQRNCARRQLQIDIEETAVPVGEHVQRACEILGLDSLCLANEGPFLAFAAPQDTSRALDPIRAHSLGVGAQIIGTVAGGLPGLVIMGSRIGANRVLDMLSGELLPPIC